MWARALTGVAFLALLSLLWPVPDSRVSTPDVMSLRVVDREGTLLRELRPEGSGLPIALADLPSHAVDALLSIEDRRYFTHPGVDPIALVRAAADNLRAGRIVSGGSTLTMQVARTLRGSPARSFVDKLAEAHLALRLEVHLSKEEILSLWLNRVYFGNQAYGIESAARTYLGKGAADLTVAEAAFLVGLPQSPVRLDPFRAPDEARRRQLRVLDALVATGRLDPEERDRHAALPLILAPPERTFLAPQFVETIVRTLPEEIREVRTTMDLRLQRDIEALARTHLARLDAEDVGNAAVVVLDNASGDVLAYMGSVDYWDTAAHGQNDGVQALRQPGSTDPGSRRRFRPPELR
jgi:penicillin-binding protein 1C